MLADMLRNTKPARKCACTLGLQVIEVDRVVTHANRSALVVAVEAGTP